MKERDNSLEGSLAVQVGAIVEYEPAVGSVARGTVTRVVDGRVYITIERTNTRGRKVTRMTEVWFDPHEVDRLRVVLRS